MPVNMKKPVLLQPNNFMPLTRTPWAGSVITTHYKDEVMPELRGRKVGESWEFSCDSKFPSSIEGENLTLTELVAAQPAAVFGSSIGQTTRIDCCEILVKIVDAAQPLSLQIHPTDDDPDLGPGACGKPESWYVLQAEPGAGIYLGFNRALLIDELRGLLQREDEARGVLQFVHVQPGDYFEISPGVPHAIGAGVTLLEPQRVLPGKSGMTFRMWDWGRLYNQDGKLDMNAGKARELHLEESLKLADPQRQVGKHFVESCRRKPLHKRVNSTQWTSFPANSFYQLHIVDCADGDNLTMLIKHGYGALVVLNGSLTTGGFTFQKGRSALLPNQCFPFDAQLTPLTKLAVVVPANAGFQLV